MIQRRKYIIVCVFLVICFMSSGAFAQQVAQPKTAKEAIDLVVMANRILSNENVFDYLGHVTVRNPENPSTFFISRALAPDQVTAADILEVALDGKVITKTQFTPYSERIIHGGIYKARPDVNAVVHAHPIELCIMANAGVQPRPVIHQACIFYEGVPIYNDYDFTAPKATGHLVTTQEEGDRFARLLGTKRAVIMVAHGVTVVGSSVPSAVHASVTLRDNAVVQLGAERAGKAVYMTEAQSKLMLPILANGFTRAWDYYVSRMKRIYSDMR